MQLIDRQLAEDVLSALGEQLAAQGAPFELVVIGGSALLALGLIDRPTRDVDVVALREADRLIAPKPLPEALGAARDRVAADFNLPENWLNAAAASLLDFGLPDGFLERVETRRYGVALGVHFASRLDQVHLKLYAAIDHQGLSKHEADLRALRPTGEELLQAARWARTHDPSEGFLIELRGALRHLGVPDDALGA